MKDQLAMVSSEHLYPEGVVGRRVESGGFFGTVRFIGSLPEHPGKWYGIEWDDPSRGKHNGSINGIQYFQTQHPTAGSFVRREKINFGQSLGEAIATKYGNKESDIAKKVNEQEVMMLQKTIKAPFIEFVGFDELCTKQSNFKSLKIVDVMLQNVSNIGQPGELKALLPNVKHLNLSKNLLTSWEDVFKICKQLNQLYCLNVSENILIFPDEYNGHSFPNITMLVCGSMGLTWSDIKKLSHIFPNINELRANNNNITDLTSEEKNNFYNLEVLDLEHNPIGSWDEIMKLDNIKSLQNLSIGHVGLDKIDFKTELEKVECFENLTKLCLNGNNIIDWVSVSELNRLKSLEELRFLYNPILTSEDPDTVIALVVAKIGNLKVHNGRILTGGRMGDEFRRGCEYDYLKKYGLEWLRVKNSTEQTAFLKEHNRYLELIEKYGELEADELKVEDTTKLKYTLINLKIQYKEQIIMKKVAPSMLVIKLKILVQRLFKLKEEPMVICQTEHDFEIPLDDETKELNYFSVKNDDTILIRT